MRALLRDGDVDRRVFVLGAFPCNGKKADMFLARDAGEADRFRAVVLDADCMPEID